MEPEILLQALKDKSVLKVAPMIQVRDTLYKLGIHARKGFGQHFLVNPGVLVRIIEAADLTQEDTVVEVGPGLGILTRELASRAGRVVSLEVDKVLARYLAEGYAHSSTVTILNVDALKVDLSLVIPSETPYKVVSNLPYSVASPIIRRFLEAEHRPRLMVVMVQREVAQNMVAKPGDMSLLSVGIQVYGRPEMVGYVSPGSFYPPPKVTSAIVKIQVYDEPVISFQELRGYFEVVRAGFAAPRKQLRNSLAQGLDCRPAQVEAALTRAGVDSKRRAEMLALKEWEVVREELKKEGVVG